MMSNWPLVLTSALGMYLTKTGGDAAADAAERDARVTAEQLRHNAGQVKAAGQREGENELRKSQLAISRMVALAAASGAGASDPTVVKLASTQAGEGELAAMMQRYNADSSAHSMLMEAGAAEISGRARASATRTSTTGSLLSSAHGLYSAGVFNTKKKETKPKQDYPDDGEFHG